MRKLTLIVTCLVALTVQAKRPLTQHWYSGHLVLMDNQIIEREFNYDAYTDLLQVKEGGRVKVYSARQVKSFVYFDDQNNIHRSFASLLFGSRFRSGRVFFEKVLTGEITLLRRYRSVHLARRSQWEKDEIWYDSRNIYDYFIYNEKGFIPYSRFRKVVLEQMMNEYKEPLESYIRSRNLNLNTQRGQFMLICQYNVLKDPNKINMF